MNKSLLLPALAAGILLSGCVDEPYYGRVAHDGPAPYGRYYGPGYADDYGPYGRPAYDGPDYGPAGEVDFYYVGGVPYSRSYGPLVFRDNQYYSRQGGSYVTYDVEAGRRRSFRRGGNSGRRGGSVYTDRNQQYRGEGRVEQGQNGAGSYGNGRIREIREQGSYGNGSRGAALGAQTHIQGEFRGHPQGGQYQGQGAARGRTEGPQQRTGVVPQGAGSQKRKKDEHQ